MALIVNGQKHISSNLLRVDTKKTSCIWCHLLLVALASMFHAFSYFHDFIPRRHVPAPWGHLLFFIGSLCLKNLHKVKPALCQTGSGSLMMGHLEDIGAVFSAKPRERCTAFSQHHPFFSKGFGWTVIVTVCITATASAFAPRPLWPWIAFFLRPTMADMMLGASFLFEKHENHINMHQDKHETEAADHSMCWKPCEQFSIMAFR